MVVTIKDIAARANVSFQLVSAVLSNKGCAHASEKTRQKIRKVAQELGYVPNISARVLQGGASHLIGVMIDSQAPEMHFALLAEIEHAASVAGYRLLIAQAHNEPDKLLTAYQSLKQNGVDGFISLAHDYPGRPCHINEKLKQEKKLVFVLNTSHQEHSFVDVDLHQGIQLAVDHLFQQGYRHPALLLIASPGNAPTKHLSTNARLESFKKLCPQGKIYYINELNNNILEAQKTCQQLATTQFPADHVDAVIANNDFVAAILQKELLKSGYKLPQDFGLIGFDNRLIGQCLPVSLSSIGYDLPQIAHKVIDILLQYIGGCDEKLSHIFPPQLFTRESTQKFPSDSSPLNRKE